MKNRPLMKCQNQLSESTQLNRCDRQLKRTWGDASMEATSRHVLYMFTVQVKNWLDWCERLHASEVDSTRLLSSCTHTHHWHVLDSLNFNISNVLNWKDL